MINSGPIAKAPSKIETISNEPESSEEVIENSKSIVNAEEFYKSVFQNTFIKNDQDLRAYLNDNVEKIKALSEAQINHLTRQCATLSRLQAGLCLVNHGAPLEQLAFGAIQGGHKELLITIYGMMEKNNEARHRLACYSARWNQDDILFNTIFGIMDECKHKPDLMTIASSAASGGPSSLGILNKLIALIEAKSKTPDYQRLAKGAEKGNHTALKDLLLKMAQFSKTESNIIASYKTIEDLREDNSKQQEQIKEKDAYITQLQQIISNLQQKLPVQNIPYNVSMPKQQLNIPQNNAMNLGKDHHVVPMTQAWNNAQNKNNAQTTPKAIISFKHNKFR